MAIVIIIAFLLTIMWGVLFLKQLTTGLTNTALDDKFTWGLYVQGFFFFSALAGGGLIFISVVTLFEINSLRPLGEVGSAVSLGCLAAAGMLLGSDLGKPFRGFRIITGKNFTSPLTWDFIALSACAILNLIYLAGIVSVNGAGSIIWAILCIIAALCFVIIHTLFFLSRVGAGFKSQPFLGLSTLAQSLLGGTALITLIGLGVGVKPEKVIRLLLILTILALIPLFGSYLASLTTRNKGDEYKKILGMDIILLVILILIQIISPDNSVLLAVGSVLILISIFLEKSHLMRQYQQNPILPLPYSIHDPIPKYSPTSYEWLLSIGCAGTCVLVSSVIFYLRTLLLG